MSQPNDPFREEYEQWRRHPTTARLMNWLRTERDALKEQWAQGGFSASFEIEMLVRNAAATGTCSAYEAVANVDFEELYNESEFERVGASGVGGAGAPLRGGEEDGSD